MIRLPTLTKTFLDNFLLNIKFPMIKVMCLRFFGEEVLPISLLKSSYNFSTVSL